MEFIDESALGMQFLDESMQLMDWSAVNVSKNPSDAQLGRLRQLLIDYDLDGYLIVDSGAHYHFNGRMYQDSRINLMTGSRVIVAASTLIAGAKRLGSRWQNKGSVQTKKRASYSGRSRMRRQLGSLG